MPEVSTALHLITRPLAQCPACSSERLELVVDDEAEEVHFMCSDCGRCFHVELGFAHELAPGACHHAPATRV
jgi:transposase-like protein